MDPETENRPNGQKERMKTMRQAAIVRKTGETIVDAAINLDGHLEGTEEIIRTGIGFLDHMLELLAFHSGFGLRAAAHGDLYVDDHHTVEDLGIALGQVLKEAIGDKRGIRRYGTFTIPMDECLCTTSLDFSGRPYLVLNVEFSREKVGGLSTEMVEEFLRALAFNAGLTLYVNVHYGKNDHHQIEAIFKSLGRALKEAVFIEGDVLPSSKGVLE